MRPPPSPSDWPRDDVDRDARLPQHDVQAPRHRDLSASSSLPCPPTAACHAEPHRVDDREADDAPRCLTSAAPAPPDSRPGGDGQPVPRDELLQSNDDSDCGCDGDDDGFDDDDGSDDYDYDYDSDSDSSDDPAHYLHHLSVPSDHDLEISDSDGGAPLDDILVATAAFASATSVNLDFDSDRDSDGSDAQDWYTDDDDDNDQALDPTTLYPSPHEALFSLFSLALHTSPDLSALIMDDEPPAPQWANVPPTHQEPAQGFAPQPPFFDNFVDAFPPVQLSNPNPTILGSENLGLVDFLRNWAHQSCFSSLKRPRPPHLHQLHKQARATVQNVTYADLRGDDCDLQGLDWTSMETTRDDVRIRRRHTYKNYVNRQGSDNCRPQDRRIPSRDSFFRFRKMTFRPDVSLAHFQLRSVLACPSRTRAYYSSLNGITRMNLASKETGLTLDLREFPAMGGVISTLDAAHGILMGGTFNGDYCIQSLDSEEAKGFSEGQISPDGITNHLRIHTPRRSARPVASIASNDRGFRVLDIETEKLVSQTMYDFALNCSAVSPDRRLRVLVGDHPNALIINADTGETLQELTGHQDYGFACDWSDDGWTVATGFQDKAVKIWDARRWCNSSGASTPLCSIRSEMAGVRGLRFSPLGSGRPILAAAEEADFINLIDAQTFASKQTVDVFSEIGGLAFADGGQDLNVLCCDAHRGGLLQLERCGGGPDLVPGRAWRESRPWLVDGGRDGLWPDEWSRHRRPTLLEGPDPF